MESIEIKDYSAIISGLITALSTLAAVLITNYFNLKSSKQNSDIAHKRDKSQRRLEKIEEFYLLFERWETNLSNVYLCHLRAYTGHLTYRDVLEIVNKKDDFLSVDAQKIKMLMNVYMPELLSEYEKVEAARSMIVPYIISAPEENDLKSKDFVKMQENFEAACAKFKANISELANEL